MKIPTATSLRLASIAGAIVLIISLPVSGQQSTTGVPVDQPAPMGLPNYATKGLITPDPKQNPQTPAAPGVITYNVTFVDPYHSYSSYFPNITTAVKAAGAAWASHLMGSANLEVQVVMDANTPRTTGKSVTNGLVRHEGMRDIFEQGATYELRTGTDPNGASPDIQINIGPSYLTNQLWFDPNPTTRTAPIPANHLDAISIFIHELGHAFVFNGWMNGTNGQLPPTYMSTFDANVHFDGTNFFFIGPSARATYGGSVPITFGNPFHLGNNSPRPGASLLPDLMNGVVFNYQTRYPISALDLAIARDAGVPLIFSNWVLQNPSSRQTQIWLMDNGLLSSSLAGPTLPLHWTLIDVDRFNADNSSDLLLFNSMTRQTAVWYLSGAAYFSSRAGPTLPAGYTLVAAQDFNGDNQPDLLLFNPTTRQTTVWYLNSFLQHIGGGNGPTLPVNYRVVGCADFNGDTKPDFLLSNGAGTVVWYLNGLLQRVNSLYGPTLPAGWVPSAVDDFNRDGHPDLAITNASTHQSAIYHLNNNARISQAFGPVIPTGFELKAPR